MIFLHLSSTGLVCVQNCREIEIVERWKWVSEIVERWKQISEIVEKYFPLKSSSQNLREIEFVENMRVSFRNCREIWKQVSEIVEKGGFFQFVESGIKTANRVGKKMICLWMAFPWPLDGTMRWNYFWSCILLYTPLSWSTSGWKATSITTNYIKFSSFLWAFSWYHS